MNIKFGMDNFYVRYLKRFINYELGIPTSVLGKFDTNDLKQLVSYLNLPNVKGMFEVSKEIVEKFPQLEDLFIMTLKDNVIKWTSRKIDETTSLFIQENIEAIKTYCKSVGWIVDDALDWIDISKDINNDKSVNELDRKILDDMIMNGTSGYSQEEIKRADLNIDGVINSEDLAIFDDYILNGKLSITIKKSNRENLFPNQDMLIFINQFDGTFLYNMALRDGWGEDDKPHENTDGIFKIALYECKPGQKITIAHNQSQPVRLVIGGSPATLKSDLTSFFVTNVIDKEVQAGEIIEYTCTSREDGTGPDVHYLCIQCPSNYSNISESKTKKLQLDTGDINFDGKIDIDDYHLLARYTAIGPDVEKYAWTPTKKQLAVMNVRKDHQSPEIDVLDAEYLYRFIKGDPRIPTLGFTWYEITENVEAKQLPNVSNLLIIDGHYEDANIPVMDFVNDDWVIHEKFFNYLLNMAVHKYSDGDDITYMQSLLKEAYPEHIYDSEFFYPTNYSDNMREIVREYQKRQIYYTTGDLNSDNKITNADLEILRNYIDDSRDYTMAQKYVADPEHNPLSPEDIARLDRNGNGVVDEKDVETLRDELINVKKYTGLLILRADINGDGYVDEQDYIALQDVINQGYFIKDGKRVTLKNYNIPFILGWIDVQTEAMLEKDYNSFGNISEVSK